MPTAESSGRPQIVSNVPLEDEYQAKLTEIGDILPLTGNNRAEQFKCVAQANAFLGWLEIDKEFYAAAPDLRVVSTPAVGYDTIDVEEATKRGIAVCNTPGVLTAAVADLTMTLIFVLARRLFENERFSRSGAWARGETAPELGHDVTGKTLGVVGFGRIGREVARRMQVLGMRAIWHDVFDQPPPEGPAAEFRPLDALLQESDFVSVHMNLNDSSKHLIGAREIGLMKKTSYFINTARGPVVDQAALCAALQTGGIAGAALDVLEPEPPAADEPIVSLPNVVSFPHIGTATHETRQAMREMAVDNTIAILLRQPPRAIVNPEVLGT